ncbi:MAG: methyltransferase domain-containing protein [Pseudomonadota bacterium]
MRERILKENETMDPFMDGRLRLIQPKTGYRFSIDAVLLAEFVTVRPGDLLIDLGTGCGIIPLILLLTRPVGHAFGLEIQADLADQAARNAIINGLQDRMDVILGDIKAPPLAPLSADVVTCNPPYRQTKSGRINPDLQRAIARHEILASLDHILGSARRLLKAKGRMAMIYPAPRMVELLARMRAFHLEPKRIRMVHADEGSEAKLALVEAALGGGVGVTVLPPLIDTGHG